MNSPATACFRICRPGHYRSDKSLGGTPPAHVLISVRYSPPPHPGQGPHSKRAQGGRAGLRCLYPADPTPLPLRCGLRAGFSLLLTFKRKNVWG